MPDFLPENFRFAHDYCLFLHDILVNIVQSGEDARIFTVPVQLRSVEEAQQFTGLKEEELWRWLESNGYEEVLREYTYRHAFVALLADFCHFVYEALRCSRKGKLTVTFALLRKPFKENLCYFE